MLLDPSLDTTSSKVRSLFSKHLNKKQTSFIRRDPLVPLGSEGVGGGGQKLNHLEDKFAA